MEEKRKLITATDRQLINAKEIMEVEHLFCNL